MPVTAKAETDGTFPLRRLYFYLTSGCNLRCRHCWIAPKYQEPGQPGPALDPHLFRGVLEQAQPLGLSGVKLTGGEPLLHPQIDELLDLIHAAGLQLTVETNGTLCTPGLAQALARCEKPHIAVSLDGVDAKTHDGIRGVPGAFAAALQGLRHLVQAGLKPQIIMAVMRQNREQLADVVGLAESLGAGSVKFNLVQPTARGEQLHETGETLSIEELVELGRWVENTLADTTPLRLYYHHPPAFRPLSRMLGPQGNGAGACGILGVLGVLGDGSYALCGIGATVPALVFGHVARDSLAEVWQHHPVLQELREGLPHRLGGVCGDCLMRSLCLGSCVAQNYYLDRDLWAPFWYCEQAREKGLFPPTRLRPAV
jgi:SynChlorMet cassette radical SAM/SPASM protein ScmF